MSIDYVCPQCGPDPDGKGVHRLVAHEFPFMGRYEAIRYAELDAEYMKVLRQLIDLQKLCADRPLFNIEYDRTACSDRDIDEWIEAIDIEGEKATGR